LGAANEKRVGDVAGFDDAAPGGSGREHAQDLVEFAPEAEQAGVAQLGGRVVFGHFQPDGGGIYGGGGHFGEARAPVGGMVFASFQVQHVGRLPEQLEAAAVVVQEGVYFFVGRVVGHAACRRGQEGANKALG